MIKTFLFLMRARPISSIFYVANVDSSHLVEEAVSPIYVSGDVDGLFRACWSPNVFAPLLVMTFIYRNHKYWHLCDLGYEGFQQ
jgi:hypothetical protein